MLEEGRAGTGNEKKRVNEKMKNASGKESNESEKEVFIMLTMGRNG